MRVYLARYEIYKNDYGDLCNPKNGSAVLPNAPIYRLLSK